MTYIGVITMKWADDGQHFHTLHIERNTVEEIKNIAKEFCDNDPDDEFIISLEIYQDMS